MGKTLGLDKSSPRREVVRLSRWSGMEGYTVSMRFPEAKVPQTIWIEVVTGQPEDKSVTHQIRTMAVLYMPHQFKTSPI